MYGSSMQAIRPSRSWYGLARLMFLGALVAIGFAVFNFISLGTQISGFQRAAVPGKTTVTFDSAGRYLLYFEGPGFNDAPSTGTVRVALQDLAGKQVTITPTHGGSQTYSIGSHSGQAVADFDISAPGSYVLSAGTPSSPAPTDIAVGRSLGGSIVKSVLLLLLGVFLFAGSVVIAVIVSVRRRGARRSFASAPSAAQGAGPYLNAAQGAGPYLNAAQGGGPYFPGGPQDPGGQWHNAPQWATPPWPGAGQQPQDAPPQSQWPTVTSQVPQPPNSPEPRR